MRISALHSHISALLLAVSATILVAEEEVVIQRVSFFAFSSPRFPVEVFYQSGKGKFDQLNLYGANTTPVLPVLNQKGAVHIYGEPVANAEGELVHPSIGTAKLDPKIPKALVILFADPEAKELRFDGRAIPISINDFPDGSVKFANLTDQRIRCRMGEAFYGIEPSSFETLRYKDPAGTVIGVLFQSESKDNTWQRMISTKWNVPNSGRTIVFAFPNPATGSPSTKSLPLPEDF